MERICWSIGCTWFNNVPNPLAIKIMKFLESGLSLVILEFAIYIYFTDVHHTIQAIGVGYMAVTGMIVSMGLYFGNPSLCSTANMVFSYACCCVYIVMVTLCFYTYNFLFDITAGIGILTLIVFLWDTFLSCIELFRTQPEADEVVGHLGGRFRQATPGEEIELPEFQVEEEVGDDNAPEIVEAVDLLVRQPVGENVKEFFFE